MATTPNQDQTLNQPQQEQQAPDQSHKTGVSGQKLAIAGTMTMIAEPILALTHAGGIGVIVGLAIGGLTYWVCDEVEQASGKEISLPGAPAASKRVKAPGQHSLLYRMLNGKSTRGEDDSEQQSQPEQASASSAARNYYLDLSPQFQPHVNEILGHCILGIGQRGTGKSNLAAKLIEQLGEHPIPMFVGDYKGDYTTLPEVLRRCVIAGAADWPGQKDCHIYWRITAQNAEHAGALIMERGVQLVFECLTYGSLDEACEIMTLVIKGMFDWSLKQPVDQRVPALVLLDEAQQFLPQNQGDSRINKELSNQLFLMFEKLNSVGRSFGFTPAFFTQRIAQIRKEVIGGSELFFLMRQTLPLDLKGYEELIGKDEGGKWLLDRRIAQKLGQGYGIVFKDGEFFVTHFEKRVSTHNNITPELEDAIAFYESRSGASLHLDEMEPLPSNPRLQGTKVSEQPRGTAVQQEQRQGQPGARPHLALVREEATVPASHPGQRTIATSRRIPGIPAELQEAAQLYRPGMSHHDLGRALHCGSTEARILWIELRKYQRVLERHASTYQLAVANGGQVASYTEIQTTQAATDDLLDDDDEESGLIKLGKDQKTGKDVTITQEQFTIAIRLRKTGKSTGYRDLMQTFDLGETHARALNKLIRDELEPVRG
jgi:hypothetical protein